MTVALLLAWSLVVEVPAASSFVRRADTAAVEWIARNRTADLTDLAVRLDVLASDWLWRIVRWTTIIALLSARRVRHLVVYAALLLTVTAATNVIIDVAERHPPAVVTSAIDPEPYTHPSRPVVELGLSCVGAMYTLLPRGRQRNRAKVVVGGAMATLLVSRAYLTVDYPTDLAVALLIGMAVPVVLFRFLTPHEAFPVRAVRRRGQPTLHPTRRTAIQRALDSQLGFEVLDVQLLRPPGSAGSTPMRLRLQRAGGAPSGARLSVFGKLYSLDNLRADRWYKLGRAIRYGRLEDEAPFADIRHLVEHEDYLLRVAAHAGLPVPASHGVLELTPGREYLLVTELLPDARQLNARNTSAQVLEDGFAIVATLWSSGLAHRDIKPANLVVSNGRLHLVDLSFAELRATPWRQAVDLGTMLLCLALYAGPERALQAAERSFTADEIAEALAATRSVTIPAQLRSLLRRDAPDLAEQLRSMVPDHPPIAIQRWSAARVALTGVTAAACVAAVLLLAYNLDTAGLL
jgi:tRNA A-37 threonylcarbamoyl transferase component Bud32